MKIEITEIESRTIVGIRATTSMATIADDIGRLIGQLMGVVGGRAAGSIVAVYHTWDGDGGDFEIAVPVAEAFEEGPVSPGILPGGRAVVADYIGPYEGLAGAWGATKAWIAENGVDVGLCWEEYVSDPCTVAPADLLTKIVFSVN